jgi:hypothetical protein
MILWAYLGMQPQNLPKEVPYLRPLAANEQGRALLAQMRKRAQVPVVMKNRQILSLGAEAQELFALEKRAADLYALAYPELSAAVGGSVGREGVVLL